MRGTIGIAGVVLLLPLGCFAPAVRPVAMADFGQVSATVGGIFPDEDSGRNWLEGSAVLAAGIAPHLQLEASGTIDEGNQLPAGSSAASTTSGAGSVTTLGPNWSLGGGLRTAIPVDATVDVQLAALYDRIDTTHVTNFCGTSIDTWHLSRETVELGIVGRIGDVVALGFWLDGMLDEVTFDTEGGPGDTVDFGLRLGVEFHPWPESFKWLGFVVGASAGGLQIASVSGEASGPDPWVNLGLGATLKL